tara:strand:- start:3108 stop:6014 length:2907 start_codon:yes stop_codon:yes gene_type:complete
MSIIPLRYLSSTVTAGESRTPADASSAAFSKSQTAVQLGEPVPIVFCRRVSSNGGVLVRPKASEARFDGDTSVTPNALKVYYVLVVSEGELPGIQIRDCWVGSCRRGTWNQSYNRRPGAWLPGRVNAELTAVPEHCGTGGSYEGMTTISFFESYLEFSKWSLQSSVFIREGMKVTRLLDSTLGPSNNFVDLVVYLMQQSKEIPNALIDTAQMTKAANFVNANSLFFNGQLEKPSNLIDWVQNAATGFLLKLVKKNGKLGLTPLVQHAADYTFSDKKVNWLYTFLNKHLVIDGIDISYVSAEDRKPIQFEVLWRQQPDDDIGYIRSTLVKMQGATDRIQTLDLSAFCTSELHATKVAAYNVAIRKYVSHYATIRLRPGDYSTHLIVGDIVRVRLANETKQGPQHAHDFLYQIQSIKGNLDGTTVIDLMHYPLNQNGQSLLTLGVKNATSPGSVYSLVRKSISCDDVLPTDTTLLIDTGIDFSAMLSDSNWDVFSENNLALALDELNDFNIPSNFYEGPFPINDLGLQVVPGLGLGNIEEVDADPTFDPESQPVAKSNQLDAYPDGINPEAVVEELQPTHERCGINTGLNREEEVIPESGLDEDGNPSNEDSLQPFYLPWEKWSPGALPSNTARLNAFSTELSNKKNSLELVPINTSTWLTLTPEQCPWGAADTRVSYYRIQSNGSETFIKGVAGTWSPQYPLYDAGYTFRPDDVGKTVKVELYNVNDSTQKVHYADFPKCTASVLNYDWLVIKMVLPDLASPATPNTNMAWAFKSSDQNNEYPSIEGVFPKSEKILDTTGQEGIGEGQTLTANESPTEVSEYMKNIVWGTHSQGSAAGVGGVRDYEIVYNLNAYQVAFPELPNIISKFYPAFMFDDRVPSLNNPVIVPSHRPTSVQFTIEATFYKGTFEGRTSTIRPLVSSSTVLTTSKSYTATGVVGPSSGIDYGLGVVANTSPITFTVDLNNYSVTA